MEKDRARQELRALLADPAADFAALSLMSSSRRRSRHLRTASRARARRAQQSRRARAERQQQLADRCSQLLDPQTSPAEVAELLAAELPDSIVVGAMVQMRMRLGVPAEEVAETARLMQASRPEPPGAGALAVAAWAAHAAGDEDAERRYARELLARADADGDAGQRLEVIRSVSVRGHPGEACELIEPYLREHPGGGLAAEIYADAIARVHGEAEPGERGAGRPGPVRGPVRASTRCAPRSVPSWTGRTGVRASGNG